MLAIMARPIGENARPVTCALKLVSNMGAHGVAKRGTGA